MNDSIPDRDHNGQFQPGCKPGPGRPPVARERQYLELFRETIDLDEWKKAVLALLQKAQQGDLRAFEILAKYLLPLPAQRLKINSGPQEEFRVAGQSPGKTQQEMLERLMQKIKERREYEAILEKDGHLSPNVQRNQGKDEGTS